MRTQLKGPNAWSEGVLFALASTVSLIHWSGVVLPWTTTRWKSDACSAGRDVLCLSHTSLEHAVSVTEPDGLAVVGLDSVTHGAPL